MRLANFTLPFSFLFSACSALKVQESSGAPVGPSARAGNHIVTILHTVEPYLPSLHHNPDNDRFRLSLVLHSTDGKSRKLIPLASGLRLGDFIHSARILGDDGRRVWFEAAETMAYDYVDHRLLAKGSLPTSGQPRTYLSESRISATKFLSDAKTFEPNFKKPRLILALDRRHPLELASPASNLLVHRTGQGIYGTIAISRITPEGKVLWTSDTNIQDLEQVLPGPNNTALIGLLQPKVKDEVRGPNLVLIDNETGAITTQSLWIKQ